MPMSERERLLLLNGKHDCRPVGTGDGPLYTIADFAAALKVSEKRMRDFIGPAGPEPVMARQGRSGGYRNYYRLDALKAWWAGLDADTKKKIRGEA